MSDDPVGDVTVTIYRGETAITCAIVRKHAGVRGYPDLGILSVIEALDEDGKPMKLSPLEEARACRLARGGVDETGR